MRHRRRRRHARRRTSEPTLPAPLRATQPGPGARQPRAAAPRGRPGGSTGECGRSAGERPAAPGPLRPRASAHGDRRRAAAAKAAGSAAGGRRGRRPVGADGGSHRRLRRWSASRPLALALAAGFALVPPPGFPDGVRRAHWIPLSAMDVETAIRTRRTHKAYRPEPVDRATLDELFELARWAPNHHLTNPWRFRVVGPQALERLKEAAGPEAAAKLDRAPTLVVCSCALGGDAIAGRGGPPRDRVRRLHRPARRPRPRAWPATGAPRRSCARDAGRAAVGLGGRRAVRRPDPPRPAGPGAGAAPERAPVGDVVTYLD